MHNYSTIHNINKIKFIIFCSKTKKNKKRQKKTKKGEKTTIIFISNCNLNPADVDIFSIKDFKGFYECVCFKMQKDISLNIKIVISNNSFVIVERKYIYVDNYNCFMVIILDRYK